VPSQETNCRATEHHLPYEIVQYYLPPNTNECTLTPAKQASNHWCSIYLTQKARSPSMPGFALTIEETRNTYHLITYS